MKNLNYFSYQMYHTEFLHQNLCRDLTVSTFDGAFCCIFERLKKAKIISTYLGAHKLKKCQRKARYQHKVWSKQTAQCQHKTR